uniref:Uncharacterized protein n=1 Tax=Pseudo-nitzschia arenysensis TaxID=697910 RepID=A0A7S0F7F3_9STRA|mmetsp:Transcript_324/g.736  ORF Transcript_324/g.736 Transcript_324/m.736 type:complete len:381 (+) Transcript_324:106-1248(+)
MIPTSLRSCAGKRIRKEVFLFGHRNSTKHNSGFGKLFSTSSSSSRKEPRLSSRNKRDLLFLAVGTCGFIGYYLHHRDDNWKEDVWKIKNKLKASSIVEKNKRYSRQENSFSSHTPPVILSHLEKALQHRQQPPPLIVTAHQSGEFLASRQWYPFEATLMAAASTTNPGFVWDAQTNILNLSNNVLEYLISTNKSKNDSEHQECESESGIVTKVWGKYPLIQIEEEDPFILFWLAMTPLFPAVFLAMDGREGLLKWKDNNVLFDTNLNSESGNDKNTSAKAHLADGKETLLVEFLFRNEDGLLHKIKVTSQKNPERELWQAVYKNYTQHIVAVDWDNHKGEKDNKESRQILIPSYIEIGKGEGDQYRPHFKIYNRNLSYQN